MDRKTAGPLTPAEAKERLRSAAREVGMTPWIRRHPLESLAAGLALGYLLQSVPPRARRSLAYAALRTFLQILPALVGPARPYRRRG